MIRFCIRIFVEEIFEDIGNKFEVVVMGSINEFIDGYGKVVFVGIFFIFRYFVGDFV